MLYPPQMAPRGREDQEDGGERPWHLARWEYGLDCLQEPLSLVNMNGPCDSNDKIIITIHLVTTLC